MAATQIPLDEVVYFDVITSSSTGAATDADSTPTFAVYEESTDTDIGVGGNFTKRTSLTGNYRASFTVSSANGFEVGKWYAVIGSATVGSVTGKCVCLHFRVLPAEVSAGVSTVLLSSGTGTGQISLSSGAVLLQATQTGVTIPTVTTVTGFTASDVGAIKAKTDSLTFTVAGDVDVNVQTWKGSAAADMTGDAYARLGANGAGLTALATAAELAKVPKSDSTVTWNATALASINAEVDSALNTAIPGSPTANSINERIATMDGLLLGTIAAGTHNPQSGDAYALANGATGFTAIDNVVDAIRVVTDRVDTALVMDGAVYQFTANALELGPSGGGGVADWTADERTAIRAILGIPGSGTTPADPTTGIMDTIRDYVDGLETTIGVAGAGLTALASSAELAKVPKSDSTVTWNATALASINAEVDSALNTAIPGSPTANSINERVATMDGLLLGTIAAGTHAAQSGDAYARLGAPAGASHAADVAAVKSDTAAILVDTGTAGVVVAAASKTGYTLTATTGLGNQTANITGNLSGSVNSVTTAVTANVTQWNGTNVATPDVAGIPDVNLTHINGSAASPAGTVSATISDKTGFKLASDGLDSIATTAPAGAASNFREMVVQTWRRFFKKATKTDSQLITYADNGTTPITTQSVNDDGSTETQGAA